MSCLITIAIPTFNNAGTIENTINSCLSQSSAETIDFEVLIVNNASTDGTAEILSGYLKHEKVRVVTNSETCTLFENHNVCLREAAGRYVLFCHSDDTLDSKAISILARKLEQRGYPDRYVVWGHSLFRDFSAAIHKSLLTTNQLFAGMMAVRPFLNGGLTPSGTCFSKDFIRYGGFYSTTNRIAPSDASSMVRLALNGFRFEMMQEILFFRNDASTAIRSITIKQKLDAFDDAFGPLITTIKSNTLSDILEQTNIMIKPPIRFYHVVAKVKPPIVRQCLLLWALKRPTLLASRLFWRVLFRTFES